MASWSSVSSASRSAISASSTAPSRPGGVGALLAREGEEAAPVELRLLDEAQQLVVVGLGLARVADDEVRAEGGLGLAAADVVDAGEEPLAVAPAPHAPQQRRRHVLQRQVEVRHAGGADRVDQRVGEVGRVEVEQPHPVDPGRPRPRRAGRCALADALVAAEGGEVLGDEHDLARLERVDLVEDRLDRARPLRAAERRDGAEPAGAVAALGHLHVGPRARRGRAGQVEQVEATGARRRGLRRA